MYLQVVSYAPSSVKIRLEPPVIFSDVRVWLLLHQVVTESQPQVLILLEIKDFVREFNRTLNLGSVHFSAVRHLSLEFESAHAIARRRHVERLSHARSVAHVVPPRLVRQADVGAIRHERRAIGRRKETFSHVRFTIHASILRVQVPGYLRERTTSRVRFQPLLEERTPRTKERESERANARTVRTRSSELVNRSFANSESEREEES